MDLEPGHFVWSCYEQCGIEEVCSTHSAGFSCHLTCEVCSIVIYHSPCVCASTDETGHSLQHRSSSPALQLPCSLRR